MDTRNTTAQHIRTALTTTTILALGLTVASAHPGHALDAVPVSHLATSPYHLVTLLLVGTVLIYGASFIRRVASRRTIQLTGAAVIVVAAITHANQFLG